MKCDKCGNQSWFGVSKSDKAIKRYMLFCRHCGAYIKWIPAAEEQAYLETYVELSGDYRRGLIDGYQHGKN